MASCSAVSSGRPAVANADPDDADVGQRRKDAETADIGFERLDTAVFDRGFEGGDDISNPVRRGVTEERQRDVGLPGVGQSKARHAVEPVLNGRHSVAQPVEVNADEQAL